jgi:hypothetical protein
MCPSAIPFLKEEEVSDMTTMKKEVEYKRFNAKQIPFNEIEEAGTYYSNWTGHLIRIPDDGLKAGSSPVIDIRGKAPMIVTKLSDDPYVTVSKARMIAADLDLDVNF